MAALTSNESVQIKDSSLGMILEGEVADPTVRIYRGSNLSWDAENKLVAGTGVRFAGVASEEYLPPCGDETKPPIIRYKAARSGACRVLRAVEGTIANGTNAYVVDSGTLTMTAGTDATLAGDVVVEPNTPEGYAWLTL